jgi:hypothetical protein
LRQPNQARLFEIDTWFGRELAACAGRAGKAIFPGMLPASGDPLDYFALALAGRREVDDKEVRGRGPVTVFSVKTRRRLVIHVVPGRVVVADRVTRARAHNRCL